MKQRLPILLAATLVTVTACGSGENDTAAGRTIAVGVMPLVATAPIYLGEEKGFFEEHGIDLDLVSSEGGAAQVPSVISGELDFAYSNIVSVMVARDQGLDIRLVTNGASTVSEAPAETAVVTPSDSDITGPRDLAGATVSVNTLENIGDTSISFVTGEDGGDPSTIEFMEIPFPQAPAALANGQVDAAWVAEPFLTQALEEGNEVVTYNYVDTHPELDIGGYFASTQIIEAEPELVDDFHAAMNQSLEYAQQNPEDVREIVGSYTEIDEEIRAEMILPAFKTEFSHEAAELLGETATNLGTLSEPPNLDEMLPTED